MGTIKDFSEIEIRDAILNNFIICSLSSDEYKTILEKYA